MSELKQRRRPRKYTEEFKNQLLDKPLEIFKITQSLSPKGCPYDNAVTEATFKIIKTEFVWNETFHSLMSCSSSCGIM